MEVNTLAGRFELKNPHPELNIQIRLIIKECDLYLKRCYICALFPIKT